MYELFKSYDGEIAEKRQYNDIKSKYLPPKSNVILPYDYNLNSLKIQKDITFKREFDSTHWASSELQKIVNKNFEKNSFKAKSRSEKNINQLIEKEVKEKNIIKRMNQIVNEEIKKVEDSNNEIYPTVNKLYPVKFIMKKEAFHKIDVKNLKLPELLKKKQHNPEFKNLKIFLKPKLPLYLSRSNKILNSNNLKLVSNLNKFKIQQDKLPIKEREELFKNILIIKKEIEKKLINKDSYLKSIFESNIDMKKYYIAKIHYNTFEDIIRNYKIPPKCTNLKSLILHSIECANLILKTFSGRISDLESLHQIFPSGILQFKKYHRQNELSKTNSLIKII